MRSRTIAAVGVGLSCIGLFAVLAIVRMGNTSNVLAQDGDPAVRAALVAKLKRLLSSERDTYVHTARVLHGKVGHQANMRRKWSQAALARNACQDGEPCKLNQMPIMRYVPSTGNWDVVSMGNPDAVWHKLLNEAKQRDLTPGARGMSTMDSIASVHRPSYGQGQKDKALAESLFQTNGDLDSEEHRQLEAKLKSLLEDKVSRGRSLVRHMSPPGRPTEAVQDADSEADESPSTQFAYKLASNLKQANELSNGGDDTRQMEHLINQLGDTDELHKLCRHAALAHNVLQVYIASSLSGCVRQLRIRMQDARQSLRSRANQLKYTSPGSVPPELPSDARYSKLKDSKASLTTQLNALKRDHSELEHQLMLQERSISKLTQEQHKAHVQTDSAPSFVASSRSSLSSPPVPPGLPPGYHGHLLADGATAVPESSAPDSR